MKKIFHDIIPQEKRSIRNIPLVKREDDEINETLDHSKYDQTVSSDKNHSHIRQSLDGMHKTKGRTKRHVIEDSEFIGNSEKLDEAEEPTEKIKVHKMSKKEEEHSREYIIKTEISNGDEITGVLKSSTTDEDSEEPESFEEWQKHQSGSSWKAISLISVVAILAIIFIPLYFSSATIRISPTKHDLSLASTKVSLGDVSHKSLDAEATETITIAANGTVKVERKATGTVVLYNAYNSASQKLVAGTRLQTPNGSIFKLKNPVIIPGQTTSKGKATPGSVSATVEADVAGDKYNLGFQDFNLVAYKGTDKYEKIYGRSKTALTNGYLGTVPNISANQIASTTTALKNSILADLDATFSKKTKALDGNYAYLSDVKQVTFSDLDQSVSKDGLKATLTLKAKATATVLSINDLAKLIVVGQTGNATNTDNSGSSSDTSDTSLDNSLTSNINAKDQIVYEGDFSKVKVDFNSKDALDSSSTILTFSGSTSIASALDKTRVARSVSTLTKEQAIIALKKIVELDSVDIDISPWWKSTLPLADKITIETEN